MRRAHNEMLPLSVWSPMRTPKSIQDSPYLMASASSTTMAIQIMIGIGCQNCAGARARREPKSVTARRRAADGCR
jgi:hypothetical protein